MKRWIKVGGWYIPIEALHEENWSPTVRVVAEWLAVAGIGLIFYLLIYLGG